MSAIEERHDALERFAAVQAFYSYLGERVKTSGRDGLPGVLRAAVDAKALDLYAKEGADRLTVDLNGQKVGAVRVNTKPVWRVTDPDAYQVWCQNAHHMFSSATVAWDEMTDAERDTVLDYIAVEMDGDRFIKEVYRPMTPAELDLAWNERDGAAIDPETGEVVPGVELATEVVGTTIEGFKIDGAKTGANAKYVPVRSALRGMLPGDQVSLLIGD